jgi:hypothetical protein
MVDITHSLLVSVEDLFVCQRTSWVVPSAQVVCGVRCRISPAMPTPTVTGLLHALMVSVEHDHHCASAGQDGQVTNDAGPQQVPEPGRVVRSRNVPEKIHGVTH